MEIFETQLYLNIENFFPGNTVYLNGQNLCDFMNNHLKGKTWLVWNHAIDHTGTIVRFYSEFVTVDNATINEEGSIVYMEYTKLPYKRQDQDQKPPNYDVFNPPIVAETSAADLNSYYEMFGSTGIREIWNHETHLLEGFVIDKNTDLPPEGNESEGLFVFQTIYLIGPSTNN
jgi:hypothetical protein